MEEKWTERGDVRLYSRRDGAEAGPTLVFANALGTDLRLWDAVLPHLPPGLRLIRWDKRGHGQSSVPPAPYHMGALVSDAEAVCQAWGVTTCLYVGQSIGGLIAQGLAVKRPDMVTALVLSNTGAKIGTPALWDDRIAAVRRDGLDPMVPAIMERWFSRAFRQGPEVGFWEEMVRSTPIEGYAGCCAAISGTDFWATIATLDMPCLGIAGSDDGSTPPDLVRETVAQIEGSHTALIHGAGHLPCVEAPREYAGLLSEFAHRTGFA